MADKSPDPAATPADKAKTSAQDDTALPQPPAPEVHTYADKDGIERISVISDDRGWTPAPTEVSYPHLEKKEDA